jgi:hypothetical protein
MTIDWMHFTPAHSLSGGVLIGIAVALLLLGNGRIAGISGIVGGLLQRHKPGEFAWRIAFVLGLILAPALYSIVSELPGIRIDSGWRLLTLAGLLVGFGSRLGSGCTSGHGVCGLSRLSPRSIVATLTFMSSGFLTVYVAGHLFGTGIFS